MILASGSALPLSIVITAHNEGGEVRRTLESIATNTDGPFEILLIDDESEAVR